MAAQLDPAPSQRRLLSALLVGATVVGAWLAVAAGVAVAVQSAVSQSMAQVPVAVRAPAWQDVTLPCVEGWSLDGSSCAPAASPAQWRGGAALPVQHAGGYVVWAGDIGVLPRLLASAPVWGGLVAAGLVALVLLPVLRTTAAGLPFAPGNARRLASAAGLVVAGWLLGTAGPRLVAPRVIASAMHTGPATGFDVPDGWLVPSLTVTWWPLLVAGLLAVLAAASRSGARLAAETEGLV